MDGHAEAGTRALIGKLSIDDFAGEECFAALDIASNHRHRPRDLFLSHDRGEKQGR
jgi:hypothetical protein